MQYRDNIHRCKIRFIDQENFIRLNYISLKSLVGLLVITNIKISVEIYDNYPKLTCLTKSFVKTLCGLNKTTEKTPNIDRKE